MCLVWKIIGFDKHSSPGPKHLGSFECKNCAIFRALVAIDPKNLSNKNRGLIKKQCTTCNHQTSVATLDPYNTCNYGSHYTAQKVGPTYHLIINLHVRKLGIDKCH